MAEVDFSKKAPARKAKEKTPATEETTAIAKTDAGAVAAPAPSTSVGDYVPSADQIILPRLNIVQGVGMLKDSFPVGSLILNRQVVLYKQPVRDAQGNITEPGTKPVKITCCGFKPVKYVEMVQGGSRGMVVNSEQEVSEANGTLDYKTWEAKKHEGMKRFSPYVEGLFLIEQPEGVDDNSFPYVVDGKNHAIVLWAMKGTAFTAAAKRTFFTDRAVGCLRKGGYPSMQYDLSVIYQKWGANGAWVPQLLATTKSSDERVAFCQEFLNAAADAPSGEDAE